MEYCNGRDLGTYLRLHKRIHESTARLFICEIVLAIEELHRHNIIFRDLKPENILLNSDGHIKLVDFGLSREGVKVN